jgi:hypothetical protein
MMIDFVKLKILNPDIDGIRKFPFLDWDQLANETSGDIKEYKAKFKGLTVDIKYNQYLYISGSLHKYWNFTQSGTNQNYNDFTFSSLTWTIGDICTRFNLNPANCKIENIEFGVNVNPTIPTNDILMSVINHKGKPFIQEYEEKKYLRECKHGRYILKFYNKGLQYRRQDNILRFENKTIRMEHLKGTGIKTLADLLDRDKISPLGMILRCDLGDLLFYDYTIQETELTPSESRLLSKGQASTYWLNLRQTNPENYYKKRNRFRDLVSKHGKQNLQETISNLIMIKWDELLQSDESITEINSIPEGLKTVNLDKII